MLSSACSAGSTTLLASSGSSSRISASRESAWASPSWLGPSSVLSSSIVSACLLTVFPSFFTGKPIRGSLLLVFPTLLSPFSAIVLPVAAGDESCTGEDLRGFAQLRNRCLQGLDALAFVPPACPLLFPPPALFGIHPCGELSE